MEPYKGLTPFHESFAAYGNAIFKLESALFSIGVPYDFERELAMIAS